VQVVLSNRSEGTVKLFEAYPGELDGAGSGMKITTGFHLNRLSALLIRVASPIIEVHLFKPWCDWEIPDGNIDETSIFSSFSVTVQSEW
jgi:hypothetical protein